MSNKYLKRQNILDIIIILILIFGSDSGSELIQIFLFSKPGSDHKNRIRNSGLNRARLPWMTQHLLLMYCAVSDADVDANCPDPDQTIEKRLDPT